MRPDSRKLQSKPRRGAILVGVMVCLLIVLGIIGSMLKAALRERSVMRQARHIRQTEFLLEAGIQRAVAQLATDSSYRGESWRLKSETLPGFDVALVEIEINSVDDSSASVHVTAKLPADSPHSVQRSHQFTTSKTVRTSEE